MGTARRLSTGRLTVLVGFCLVEAALGQSGSVRGIRSDVLRAQVEPGVVIALDQEVLGFEVMPQSGEGLYAFAQRVCGDRDRDDVIAAANGGARELLRGCALPGSFRVCS